MGYLFFAVEVENCKLIKTDKFCNNMVLLVFRILTFPNVMMKLSQEIEKFDDKFIKLFPLSFLCSFLAVHIL